MQNVSLPSPSYHPGPRTRTSCFSACYHFRKPSLLTHCHKLMTFWYSLNTTHPFFYPFKTLVGPTFVAPTLFLELPSHEIASQSGIQLPPSCHTQKPPSTTMTHSQLFLHHLCWSSLGTGSFSICTVGMAHQVSRFIPCQTFKLHHHSSRTWCRCWNDTRYPLSQCLLLP